MGNAEDWFVIRPQLITATINILIYEAVFIGNNENLIQFGARISLAIAARWLFIGLRTWSLKLDNEIASTDGGSKSDFDGMRDSQAVEDK